MKLIDTIKDAAISLYCKLDGTAKWANGGYFELYSKLVGSDIQVLERGAEMWRFEREGDKIQEVLPQIIDQYKMNYCPSKFFKLFNSRNKLEYYRLRTRIDDLLEELDRDEPLGTFEPEGI